jgi:hypothetical protein
LTVVVFAQTVALWRISRGMTGVARLGDRLNRFAEALALLTDTTEAGLATVANELEQSGRRRASRTAARASTARRISTAAVRGRSVEEIAALEALSESEIRLHLHMADLKGGDDGALLS